MRAAAWIGFACLLAACGGGGEPVPEGVLPRDKFKEVLLEAQLIEARVNHELSLGIHQTAPAKSYYEELFEAQGITEEAFKATFKYYSERPELLRPVYEEILTELGQRKDGIRQ
ncbi:MAG: DUF4296 domain-containing protein [Flavobacteriales bacterium]|nr:DUF4296 domain-containing protein [Flavobacteriales bacterium]